MDALCTRIFSSISKGDLKLVEDILDSPYQNGDGIVINRDCLINQPLTGFVTEIRRPSNGLRIEIENPTLLILAVAKQQTHVVRYLSNYKGCLDEICHHIKSENENASRKYSGVSALHLAVILDEPELVRLLVRAGANVNLQTATGETALLEASMDGNLETLNILLQNEADASIPNGSGVTCLMVASEADNVDVIKALTETGSDSVLNATDAAGRNALFYSIRNGRLDTFLYLLDCGVEIRADHQGTNIAMEAGRQGMLTILRYIIQHMRQFPGTKIGLQDEDASGQNVLVHSLESSNVECLGYLIQAGVRPARTEDGKTLLMAAAIRNNIPAVILLTKHAERLKLDLAETDSNGRNCLFYCVSGGSLEMLELLHSIGVPTRSSSSGMTVLMHAVAEGRRNVVRFLCENATDYGLDLSATDDNGWNSLMYAAGLGQLDIMELLTSHGVPHRLANDGRTILMQAASFGDLQTIEYLLEDEEFDLDIYQEDSEGWNAIHYAIHGGQMETFKFLLKKGSTLCTTVNGSTVLIEAVNRNRLDFVEYLVSNASKLGLDVRFRDKKGSNVLFYSAAVGNTEIFNCLLEAGCNVENDSNNRTVFMQSALSGHLEMIKYLAANAEKLGLKLEQVDSDGRNALFYGVESGRLDVVKFLASIDLKCRTDRIGKTNLMQSARTGSLSITEYLLSNAQLLELDINAVDGKGESALFYGIRSRRPQIVNILLDGGVEMTDNAQGMSAISLSLIHGLEDILLNFLERSTDLAQAVLNRDSKGRTVLHYFVEQGDLELLRRYGEWYRADCDFDLTGKTLLMTACKESSDTRQMDIVRYLTEVLCVDVDKVDQQRQRSALFYAVEAGSLPAVAYLLQRVNHLESDSNGLSLLMVAVVTGNQSIVAEILKSKFGRDLLRKVDKNGRNEVHYCAMHDCSAILEALAAQRCNVDLRDNQGKTPLMYACENGRYATVACLIRRGGASVDITDNEGRNVLHHCFTGTNPSLNCAKVLFQRGVGVNVRDTAGITPLMLACQACAKTHIPLIRFLIEQGADPIVQDNDGSDAFDYCPFDSEYVKAVLKEKAEIQPSERDALINFHDRLSEGVHLNSVLRGLLKDGIFTKTLNFEVMKQPHPDRIRRLIEILSFRGEQAFRIFCNVLKREGEIQLSYELRKEAYRKEIEIFW